MTLSSLQFALPATVLVVALLGAAWDLRTRRIPNLLTGSAMLLGVAMHLALGGRSAMLSSVAALLLCGGIFLLVYIAGGMGAGDVKLIAALGALVGLPHAVPLLALTAIAGGLLAIVYAMAHGRLLQTSQNVLALLFHHGAHGLRPHPEMNIDHTTMLRLPYGVAICVGSIATLWLHASRGSL